MKLKKKQVLNILFYFMICLFLLFGILKSKLDDMDELWSFLFAKNISNGLYPYKDFNVIVTPLSMFINSLFLFIRQSLIVFRILYFMYYLVMICVLNRIMKLLKVESILKYILIFVTTYLLLQECYLDYNFFQLILIMSLIYLSLKNKNYQNRKLNIIIPLIAGLTIVNKQSTGLIICFITIILIFLEKRKNIKFLLQQLTLMLIPSIIFVVYLILTNSFIEFYDLCVLGLLSFSNKIVLPNLLFFIIIVYILMIILFRKYKNRELVIIFWYAVASLFVVFPIVDYSHVVLSLIIPSILFVYVLNKKIGKSTHENTCLLITIIVVSILALFNIYSYITSFKIKSGVYKYIPADIRLVNNIEKVNKYVIDESEKHDVYIMDYSASLYNLNINKYNKYFDLFMNGNFGIKGEKEIYSIIDKKNQVFLINNNFRNPQYPSKIVSYVMNNYDKCGSIEQFDIYCN